MGTQRRARPPVRSLQSPATRNNAVVRTLIEPFARNPVAAYRFVSVKGQIQLPYKDLLVLSNFDDLIMHYLT